MQGPAPANDLLIHSDLIACSPHVRSSRAFSPLPPGLPRIRREA
jgi:hypothetical protein